MPSKRSVPTYEQAAALPLVVGLQLPMDVADANGHVNMRHYAALYDDAEWELLGRLGVDERYIADERCGVFDLEQHLRFLAELAPGANVAVHSRLVGRSDTVLHGVLFLIDLDNERISNSYEFTAGHVDLERRRITGFPDRIAGAIDTSLEEVADLGWEPPLCGSIGPR